MCPHKGKVHNFLMEMPGEALPSVPEECRDKEMVASCHLAASIRDTLSVPKDETSTNRPT